jgi:hypothetical protein
MLTRMLVMRMEVAFARRGVQSGTAKLVRPGYATADVGGARRPDQGSVGDHCALAWFVGGS